MLTSARFSNFKLFREAELPLGTLNLIIGPNASGKSSLLHGLQYVSEATFFPMETVFDRRRSARMLTTQRQTGCLALAVNYSSPDGPMALRIEFPDSGHPDFQGFRYKITQIAADGERVLVERLDDGSYSAGHQGWTRDAQLRGIERATLLRLNPRAACRPIAVGDAGDMRPDGYGLAAVLARMKLARDEDFDCVERMLSSIVPSLKRVRIDQSVVQIDGLEVDEIRQDSSHQNRLAYQIIFDFDNAKGVPAYFAPDGVIAMLAMLAAMYSENRPKLLLIDEIERGLHPKAIGMMVKQLRSLVDRDPGLQVVATTHSPYLVDHFRAEELLLTSIGQDGFGRVGRLTDHPEFERWKEEMLPGEFWSMVGEQWIDGGMKDDAKP